MVRSAVCLQAASSYLLPLLLPPVRGPCFTSYLGSQCMFTLVFLWLRCTIFPGRWPLPGSFVISFSPSWKTVKSLISLINTGIPAWVFDIDFLMVALSSVSPTTHLSVAHTAGTTDNHPSSIGGLASPGVPPNKCPSGYTFHYEPLIPDSLTFGRWRTRLHEIE